MIRKILLALLSFVCASAAVPAGTLKNLAFDQNLGAQLSLDVTLRDEHSRPVRLRELLAGAPAILVLGYYECPMLCNLVLNGVVETLQEMKPGTDSGAQLIFVSIDARETSDLARAKKKAYAKRFGRAGPEDRWHFLTGSNEAVSQLAREVGFHYAYDEAHNQYAHPSGIVVLTPSGRINRYFFGVSYPSAELQAALANAAGQRTGSPVQSLLILCSRFAPLTGKFSNLVMASVRIVALATVVCLVGMTLFGKGTKEGK